MNRIPGGSLYPTGVTRYHRDSPVLSPKQSSGSFDQLQLSHQMGDGEKRIMALTAEISKQVRMSHSTEEIDQLRRQIDAGIYQIDADKIASRMLLGVV